MFNQRKVGLY